VIVIIGLSIHLTSDFMYRYVDILGEGGPIFSGGEVWCYVPYPQILDPSPDPSSLDCMAVVGAVPGQSLPASIHHPIILCIALVTDLITLDITIAHCGFSFTTWTCRYSNITQTFFYFFFS